MSMSTQHGGGNRKPSTKPVAGAKPKQGGDEDPVDEDLDVEASAASEEEDAPVSLGKPKASPRKSAPARKTAPAGKRPAGRPAARKVAPVKVKQGAAWGPIILFSVVGLLALGIVGFAVWQVNENGLTVQERADRIDGLKDFRKINKAYTEERSHVWGQQKYDLTIANPRSPATTTRTGSAASATSTPHRSPPSTPCTPWSTVRSGSRTSPTCPPTRSKRSPRRSAARTT
ncbi:hypothetical protein GCM10027610_134240 [Dactylosporangium cerinum]